MYHSVYFYEILKILKRSVLKVRNISHKLYVNAIEIVAGRFNHRHDPVDETLYFRPIDERGSLRSEACTLWMC